MSIPSLIFWIIFVIPLVAFLAWLIRQDKRKGWIGLIVLAIIVVGAIAYTIVKNDGKPTDNTVQSSGN
ncbi:hypothetical protein FO440_07505 [Mucilaginibacter corticis]|uniref:Uncharacterized protein n=1 Tax=Mucilaginibacter corticis TaxID=2597670 RepID=A0A556MVW8_9SPHI|nr:hypothetical protein [Mucilaginibacter corticis]TSJ44012.1 hypothetical protein FO440_07505 [Mucilaginibacter corticis]